LRLIREANPDCIIDLVGNKVNLESSREVSMEVNANFAQANQILIFVEVSAKTGDEIRTLFILIAKVIQGNESNPMDIHQHH
jgi:Ras-related protein Rab-5C